MIIFENSLASKKTLYFYFCTKLNKLIKHKNLYYFLLTVTYFLKYEHVLLFVVIIIKVNLHPLKIFDVLIKYHRVKIIVSS